MATYTGNTFTTPVSECKDYRTAYQNRPMGDLAPLEPIKVPVQLPPIVVQAPLEDASAWDLLSALFNKGVSAITLGCFPSSMTDSCVDPTPMPIEEPRNPEPVSWESIRTKIRQSEVDEFKTDCYINRETAKVSIHDPLGAPFSMKATLELNGLDGHLGDAARKVADRKPRLMVPYDRNYAVEGMLEDTSHHRGDEKIELD